MNPKIVSRMRVELSFVIYSTLKKCDRYQKEIPGRKGLRKKRNGFSEICQMAKKEKKKEETEDDIQDTTVRRWWKRARGRGQITVGREEQRKCNTKKYCSQSQSSSTAIPHII